MERFLILIFTFLQKNEFMNEMICNPQETEIPSEFRASIWEKHNLHKNNLRKLQPSPPKLKAFIQFSAFQYGLGMGIESLPI